MNLYLIFPSPDGIMPGTWQNATSFAEAVRKIDTVCATCGMDPRNVTVIDASDPDVLIDYNAVKKSAAIC